MTADALRAEILRLGPWHHDLEVAPGVRTGVPVAPGTYPAELGTPSVVDAAQGMAWIPDVFSGGLGGRSLLDCACNAGGYLFEAKSHGAGRCFGFDARQHWIDQARFLAEHLPSDQLEFATCTVDEFQGHTPDHFDISLFRGILYHLPDPVASLRLVADRTDELLVVNTATRPGPEHGLVLNRESDTLLMSGVNELAWMPTGDGVVREILAWCGFPHTRLRWGRGAQDGFGRVEVFAAREAATLARVDEFELPRTERRPRRPAWLRRPSWAR